MKTTRMFHLKIFIFELACFRNVMFAMFFHKIHLHCYLREIYQRKFPRWVRGYLVLSYLSEGLDYVGA